MAEENNDRLDIDWVRTTAGALAAVSTAVLLSTLGAAGTLIGAALGSVAATVTTALYSQGLARSRQKVAAVHQQALQKVGVAQADVRRAAEDPAAHRDELDDAGERLAEAEAALDEVVQGDPRSWGERLRALPWRRIGIYAAGTFAAVVLVLSVVEAVLGNPVSSYTGGSEKGGGTSISRLTGSDSDRGTPDRDGSDRDDRDGRDQDGSDRDDPDRDTPPEDAATPSDGASETPEDSTGGTPTPTPSPSDGVGEQPSETPPTTSPTPTPDMSQGQLTDQRVPSGVPSDGALE